MGSLIEFNDTLQITVDQGFPDKILDLARHQNKPVSLEDVKDKIFEFYEKPGARVFHLPPTRCFLVQNISGKWLYWGKVLITEQTIDASEEDGAMTSGVFKIIEIYDPEYQKQITRNESPKGKSYF